MDESTEEITIPTETSHLATVRHAGLIIFLGAAVVLFGTTLLVLATR